ncbi:GH116 family glycosyl-hydrolase [Mycobacterium sp.]|uniref:GH116 family glycosyl-hydrolase n=1 Tax=Mycobacterium sp. TaxID=1785 RepID=UPI002B5C4708|nr:GH116 family glycosyl-hydrolase [Mycobacterium sp.]HTQ22469.1 GH116 family glycosyl-hydrolase [Mycobacterium sp.]
MTSSGSQDWPDDVRADERDGAQFAHLAMPLGGIGTGNLAICADGGLRQWQLHNIGNHDGALPGSFFAVRVSRWEPPLDQVRILQGPLRDSTGTPLVTDDVVPDWQRDLLSRHPGVAGTTFSGTYPIARVRYLDPGLPLDATLEAFNPLVPLDVDASSIPAALFTFRLVNTDSCALHGTLGAAVQNAVGWDGITPVDGVRAPGYGGNTNRLLRRAGWTSIVLENATLADDAPGAGQLVLAADDARAAALTQWRDPAEFVTFLRSRALASGAPRLAFAAGTADPQRHAPHGASGASPAGSTWNAGLGVPFSLQPGEERLIRIALTWYFPNRYVNFEQFGPDRPEWGRSRFWLGNYYATRYGDAQEVFERVRHEWHTLREATGAWTGTLARCGLDDAAATHFAAQLATVRSPTCFRAADGRFFAFEGVLGASTMMWSGRYGGSCPLNCTHVWNYAQGLAAAFPQLERNMRDTEFEIMQAPAGQLPHRVIAPTYLPQLWDEPIGGPGEPALDGMLGTVLKAYREYRCGADRDWLAHVWPNLTRLLGHVDRTWNVDGTGMLSGVQPSTYDIDITGYNPFTGTLWLAALRAAETIALLLDDADAAAAYRATFGQASKSYDETLFTGEYYAQRLPSGLDTRYQWGTGCLSDQLIGQWWAHQLGLGYLLPTEHVRTALAAVVRHNLRRGFAEFTHPYRIFADGDDTGLLVCTWPRGGRPAVPIRYADEVWTGSEYQVAAHCLREGLHREGRAVLDAVWARYDGRRRNPFNEIECGDHYARSLAGWSALQAMAGFTHDGPAGAYTFRHPDSSLPFLACSGWGLWSRRGDELVLTCDGGQLDLRRLTVVGGADDYHASVAGTAVPTRCTDAGIEFPAGLRLSAGQTLILTNVGDMQEF